MDVQEKSGLFERGLGRVRGDVQRSYTRAVRVEAIFVAKESQGSTDIFALTPYVCMHLYAIALYHDSHTDGAYTPASHATLVVFLFD